MMGRGGFAAAPGPLMTALSVVSGAAILVGLTDTAASRITHRRTPSAVLTRIPLLMVVGILVGSLLWGASSGPLSSLTDFAMVILGAAMGLMTLCSLFFCTADKAPMNRNPFAIRKLLRRELPGGLPWVVLMTALLVIGTTAFTLAKLVGAPPLGRPPVERELISMALAALTVPIGIGAVTLLASAYARKRALAAMLGFLFSLIVWLGFPIHAGIVYSMNKHINEGPGFLTAYFWPLLPFWDRLNAEGDPAKLLGVSYDQLGVVTAVVYLAITVLALMGYVCAKPMRKVKTIGSDANDRAA